MLRRGSDKFRFIFLKHDHIQDFTSGALWLTVAYPFMRVSEDRSFKTTRWSVVEQAGSAVDSERVEALDALVRQYSPALVEFLRRSRGVSEDVAEEWVQGFMAHRLLGRNLLRQADSERGRFRTFLMKAIQSYVLDGLRAENAQKRRPAKGFRSLTEVPEEMLPVVACQPVELVFDDVFARQVILEAIQQTHEYCLENGLKSAWVIFFSRILGPLLEGTQTAPYAELVRELELESEAEAYNKLATAKEIFRKQFRDLVEDYSIGAQERDEEIEFLKRFLKD